MISCKRLLERCCPLYKTIAGCKYSRTRRFTMRTFEDKMSNRFRVYCKRHSDHPCFYLSDADKHLDSIYIDAACLFAG